MSVVVPVPAAGPPESPRGLSTRRLLRFCAAIAACCAAAAFTGSAVLSLRSVSVTGNAAVPEAQILRRAGIAPGMNVFRVNTRSIRQRLLGDPRIEAVTVALEFPQRLTVEIRERPAVAALRAGETYVLVGSDAVAIAQATDPGPLPALVADRLDPAAVSVGVRVASPDVRLGAWIAAALPDLLRPRVAGVHVDGAGDAGLELRDGTAVRLGGAADVADRLSLLPQVLEVIDERSVRIDSVDLRFSGSIVIQPARSSGRAAAAGGRQENSRSRGINFGMHRP